ncbi:MAG TPA: hypothetical protein VKX46_14980 [Ktedonobacteraceae bacterium]|nr:hypothetical protein [Ktedonobacteraceae bacterium]
MYNDSLDTLLLRHYGSGAATPPDLEQRIIASVRQEAAQRRQQRNMPRVNRRRAVQIVAVGSAGLGILAAALDGFQMLGVSVTNNENNQQPAFQ